MHDIKFLEEEWLRYKKNQKKPYIIGAVLSLGLLIGSLLFLNSHYYFSSKYSKDEKPINKRVKKTEKVLVLPPAKPEIQKESVEEIKPPVNVMIEEKVEETLPVLPVIKDIPILEKKTKLSQRKKIKQADKKKLKLLITDREKPHGKKHLNIIESSSISAYKEVEKRFRQSKDIDDSLFLATNYYRQGKYKKAEYWADQTNRVNKNIEESWIILAKSKVKLGDKSGAIWLLKKYIKRSHSSVAKELLRKLKS